VWPRNSRSRMHSQLVCKHLASSLGGTKHRDQVPISSFHGLKKHQISAARKVQGSSSVTHDPAAPSRRRAATARSTRQEAGNVGDMTLEGRESVRRALQFLRSGTHACPCSARPHRLTRRSASARCGEARRLSVAPRSRRRRSWAIQPPSSPPSATAAAAP
jgi:hypothetical protein